MELDIDIRHSLFYVFFAPLPGAFIQVGFANADEECWGGGFINIRLFRFKHYHIFKSAPR